MFFPCPSFYHSSNRDFSWISQLAFAWLCPFNILFFPFFVNIFRSFTFFLSWYILSLQILPIFQSLLFIFAIYNWEFLFYFFASPYLFLFLRYFLFILFFNFLFRFCLSFNFHRIYTLNRLFPHVLLCNIFLFLFFSSFRQSQYVRFVYSLCCFTVNINHLLVLMSFISFIFQHHSKFIFCILVFHHKSFNSDIEIYYL